jgi:predicted HTH transcriptional regulator
LINQFIHQEYGDPSAPAQIVIRPGETMLFNVGHSLVDPEQLTKGGRSQSRNPLIARALRLIGFADLGGSGIRVMENAWRRARRRPPRFENNREANNFTLTLDWRPLPALHDEFWHSRLGVKLTVPQARALDLIRAAPRAVDEVCSALSIEAAEVERDLDYMERQILIQRKDGKYDLVDHMREILG